MQFKRVLLHLFLFGFVIYMVKSQEPPEAIANDEDDTDSDDSTEPVDDPDNDDDSALAKLANITTIEEFFDLLERDGHPVPMDEYISPHESEDGKQHITNGGGRMAEPDDCSPRDTTVKLPLDNSDPQIVYFPRCTKVKRCGGCCSSSNLECVPAYIERETLQVIRAEVPFAGSSHLEPTGFSTVIVEKHVTCRVHCNLNAEKCGPKKYFMNNICDCKCRNYERCRPPHTWDKEECACTCPGTKNCCPRGDNCGLKFNPAICDCDIDDQRSHISVNTSYTQEQLEEYLASRNNTFDEAPDAADTHAVADDHHNPTEPTPSPSPTTPTTTTPTTTTPTTPTTTESTTEADPCEGIHCPPNFEKRVNEAGHCTCRPGRRFNIGRNRLMFGGRG